MWGGAEGWGNISRSEGLSGAGVGVTEGGRRNGRWSGGLDKEGIRLSSCDGVYTIFADAVGVRLVDGGCSRCKMIAVRHGSGVQGD